MEAATKEVTSAETWGPVCRGFSVSFPDGVRGCIEDIRLAGDVVELIVATGLFVRERVSVAGTEVEAILPRARRIIVEASPSRPGTAGVETAGGIVRMATRHSLRLAERPEEAA